MFYVGVIYIYSKKWKWFLERILHGNMTTVVFKHHYFISESAHIHKALLVNLPIYTGHYYCVDDLNRSSHHNTCGMWWLKALSILTCQLLQPLDMFQSFPNLPQQQQQRVEASVLIFIFATCFAEIPIPAFEIYMIEHYMAYLCVYHLDNNSR